VNVFLSLRDYEEFIYTLKQRYPSIVRSTLVVVPLGRRTAILEGELGFTQGYRISVWEQLSADTGVVVIENYGYELWRDTEKFSWYDPQPHRNIPTLASTFPHHKHMQPDIKHNRIPAPGMSFTQPNLPLLIQEIELLLAGAP
jgi:hypothetical protein